MCVREREGDREREREIGRERERERDMGVCMIQYNSVLYVKTSNCDSYPSTVNLSI